MALKTSRAMTLFEAVMRGTPKRVQDLLIGSSKFTYSDNWTHYALLHYAIKMNDFEIIKMLLSKGASINHVGENGETPICFAMKKVYNRIVDLLLSAGSAESDNTVNDDKFSHFHIACIRNNASVVEKFMNSGVDINDSVSFDSKEWAGYIPLHFAVDNNSLSVLELLLKKRCQYKY